MRRHNCWRPAHVTFSPKIPQNIFSCAVDCIISSSPLPLTTCRRPMSSITNVRVRAGPGWAVIARTSPSAIIEVSCKFHMLSVHSLPQKNINGIDMAMKMYTYYHRRLKYSQTITDKKLWMLLCKHSEGEPMTAPANLVHLRSVSFSSLLAKCNYHVIWSKCKIWLRTFIFASL